MIDIIFSIAILIFSVILHEVSHGFTANALGDPTAKHAGRLTLNPIPHIDPIGSVLLPAAQVLLTGQVFLAWAKPVPYNPNYLSLRNKELGSAIVGVAGPLTNILLALIFSLLVRFSGFFVGFLGAFAEPMLSIFTTVIYINLMLAVFNLVPIPPLDGSKVLFYLFSSRMMDVRMMLEQYGPMLLLVFIFFFSHWILPVVNVLFSLLTGLL